MFLQEEKNESGDTTEADEKVGSWCRVISTYSPWLLPGEFQTGLF